MPAMFNPFLALDSVSESLGISTSPLSLFGSRSGPGVITSNSVTATASGGTGPYTYAWTSMSGEAAASSPTAATTVFTKTEDLSPYVTYEDFEVVATDSLGNTGSKIVQVTFTTMGFF